MSKTKNCRKTCLKIDLENKSALSIFVSSNMKKNFLRRIFKTQLFLKSLGPYICVTHEILLHQSIGVTLASVEHSVTCLTQKKSFQKHCKVKELLKNNFYQFIVLDLKPDLIIKMLATNARPTNTYSNDFQRNFAFGFRRSSPKMCDECCSKIKHVFRMLMAT